MNAYMKTLRTDGQLANIFMFVVLSFIFISLSFADSKRVFVRDRNIYLMDSSGGMVQLTNSGRDSKPVLSSDRRQAVFIRQVQELKDNPFGLPETDAAIAFGCWSPYEIWTIYLDEMVPKQLIKSHYNPHNPKENIGWFMNIIFSPDSKKIYFDGLPASPTTYTIHCADRDGTNEHWIHYGKLVDVIDGDKEDPYYGHLLIEKRSPYGAYDIFAVITPEGKEVETFPTGEEDIKEFWRKHRR